MPSDRVVSVVGRGYRLVSHAEALGLAQDCAREAFPETKPGEWQVTSVDAPSTGGTCFIDLAHNSAALDFSGLAANDKPEVYGPFVRVTNSYNRTRALCFDIGYSRKVCKNGLILRDSLISFKMSHQRREIREAVTFEIAHDRLAKQKQEFQAFLARLQACAVPSNAIAGSASDVLPSAIADLIRWMTAFARFRFWAVSGSAVCSRQRTPRKMKSMTSRPVSFRTVTLAMHHPAVGHRKGQAIHARGGIHVALDVFPDVENLAPAEWADVVRAFDEHAVFQALAERPLVVLDLQRELDRGEVGHGRDTLRRS